MKTQTNIYLDHAASTPIDLRVADVIDEANRKYFGNPSALNRFGQESSAAIFKARRKIANYIEADHNEIVFTGSATEANNLALRGALKKIRNEELGVRNPKVVVSAIEHESVLDTARSLENEGVEVVYLPVSRSGLVDLKKLDAALDDRTVLVSIQYANSETGIIQPIAKISEIVRNFREELRNVKKEHDSKFIIHNSVTALPLLHTDAVQAFQYLDCGVENLGVDMMTLSAHKIYGPKGIGLLYVRKKELGVRNQVKQQKAIIHNSRFIIQPTITGGGQEFGLRSGTENVAGILGFAKAVEINEGLKNKESKRVVKLKQILSKKLEGLGAEINNPTDSLPNILNVYFPRLKSSDLLPVLDILGVSASAGSACRSRSVEPSYVLSEMGFPQNRILGSIRFSLGRKTTRTEINKALKLIKESLSKISV